MTLCPTCGKEILAQDRPSTGARPYLPVLVGISAAKAQLGLRTSQILEMVDTGDLLWVFNVATSKQGSRELRFWFGELLAMRLARSYTMAHVIECIVGHPTERALSARTVGEMLDLTRPAVIELIQAGHILGYLDRGATRWYLHRASLVSFLRSRHAGLP